MKIRKPVNETDYIKEQENKLVAFETIVDGKEIFRILQTFPKNARW